MSEDEFQRLRDFAHALISHPAANGTIDATEQAGESLAAALKEIERLRAEVAAWREAFPGYYNAQQPEAQP